VACCVRSFPFFSMTVQPVADATVGNLALRHKQLFLNAFLNALPATGLPCRRTVAALKWAWPMAFCSTDRSPHGPLRLTNSQHLWPVATDRWSRSSRSACRFTHGAALVPHVQPPDPRSTTHLPTCSPKAAGPNSPAASARRLRRRRPSPEFLAGSLMGSHDEAQPAGLSASAGGHTRHSKGRASS